MAAADNRSRARPRPAHKHRRGEQDIYAGERLRVARQLAGVSQQQLGEALGISFQAVQKYESGENRLSAGRMVNAAAFLGVDLAFFAKDRAATAGEAIPVTGFTAEEIEVVRAWRALRSEALRSQLKRLLQTMATAPA
ncbi:MAG: helix-turn-helix domain-containing protein [Stellaceae bacterium]